MYIYITKYIIYLKTCYLKLDNGYLLYYFCTHP